MCSSRNCRKCVKGAKLCGFCSSHLCKLLHHSRYRPYSYHKLLLCALVQVASKAVVTIDLKQSSSALRTCASCFRAIHARQMYPFASALCTCASCFDEKLAKVKENIVLLLCALVQVASDNPELLKEIDKLLLCALVQVASINMGSCDNVSSASALRTCASCFRG